MTTAPHPHVAVLCGGVGAARFLRGLLEVVTPAQVTGIVNVGDDSEIHGLHVSPDLDTITYTLSDAVNTDTGWGLVGETWHAMQQVRAYAASAGVVVRPSAALRDGKRLKRAMTSRCAFAKSSASASPSAARAASATVHAPTPAMASSRRRTGTWCSATPSC